MPSFQDSAFLVLLALLLFGPKGLAKLARELGKLMGEFRRASSEFRLQMDEEFRLSEQEEQQKKIAAMEAAAPVQPAFPLNAAHPVQPDPLQAEPIPEPEHPHAQPEYYGAVPSPVPAYADAGAEPAPQVQVYEEIDGARVPADSAEPLPIASSGDLHMMPPATGLPVSRSASSTSLGSVFDSIPHTPEPSEATHNG